MDHLPSETVTDILAMLPSKSVLRFRSVCKEWRNMIDRPGFAAMHFNRATQADTKSTFFFSPYWCELTPSYIVELDKQDPNPPLLNTIRKRKRHTNANRKADTRLFITNTTTKVDLVCPERFVHENDERLTKLFENGLICLASDLFITPTNCETYICNPATREFVKLPELISPSLLILTFADLAPAFGFDVSTNQFKVVQYFNWVQYGDHITEAQVFTLGSKSWRKLENVPKVYCCRGTTSASVNGSLHWLTTTCGILSFDLGSEKFGHIPHPQFSNGGAISGARFVSRELMNLGGCLSIADYAYVDHIELWSMKEYNVNTSWTKLIIMKKYALGRKQFSKLMAPSIYRIAIDTEDELEEVFGHIVRHSYFTPVYCDSFSPPDSRFKLKESATAQNTKLAKGRFSAYDDQNDLVVSGVAALAGSTVMFLTLLWGTCVVADKVDLSMELDQFIGQSCKTIGLLLTLAANISLNVLGATGAGQRYIWMAGEKPGTGMWELGMRSKQLWDTLVEGIEEQGFSPLQELGWKKTGSLMIGRS
ncbi:hypothetical protein IFM89_021214 [Coptis chinensis]|uniref:F-box domain-containing protein n=1 Tax=Coptis chinensis TaxID=261450 RepID=A0A835LM96_9MAGN|nr:hypothetical protein IFM89_021214 [Coptis chinensis]